MGTLEADPITSLVGSIDVEPADVDESFKDAVGELRRRWRADAPQDIPTTAPQPSEEAEIQAQPALVLHEQDGLHEEFINLDSANGLGFCLQNGSHAFFDFHFLSRPGGKTHFAWWHVGLLRSSIQRCFVH